MRFIYAALAAAYFVSPSHAQTFPRGDGVRGWNWNGQYYSSAEEACRAQWRWAGMDNGYSRFLSARPYTRWSYQTCSWTHATYLCPEEHGLSGLVAVNSCGTASGGSVNFECEAGYYEEAPGYCELREDRLPDRPESCSTNAIGGPNPAIGNPILLRSGEKILHAQDFTTEDGRFVINRNYRSRPYSRVLNDIFLPLGLPSGWQFNFSWEVNLGLFYGSPQTPNANVTVIGPDGSAYDFKLESNGAWTPVNNSDVGFPATDVRLAYDGTLPSDLSDVKRSSSRWRITDANDNVWLLETVRNPTDPSPQYVTGRPLQKTARNGYVWTFAYEADQSLRTITDSFGRIATFTWQMFHRTALQNQPDAAPYPQSVSEIALPDGTRLRYGYDPAPSPPPSTSQIARLIRAERLSPTGTVVDSTAYHYEDDRFPTFVTGMTDRRSVRTATYAYDSRGRVTSSEGAGGLNRHTVAYAEANNILTRRVINPLGKATVYRFQRFSAYPPDIRLIGIDGEASTNCPASAKTYSYDWQKFVVGETDAEGRGTTYVRDSRGRPTSITRGAP